MIWKDSNSYHFNFVNATQCLGAGKLFYLSFYGPNNFENSWSLFNPYKVTKSSAFEFKNKPFSKVLLSCDKDVNLT